MRQEKPPRRNACFRALRCISKSIDITASERSAARLAHRSGGPGVGSSNLPAPTNFPHDFRELPHEGATANELDIGTNRRQRARTGANNPKIFPKDVRQAFRRPDDPPHEKTNTAQVVGRGGVAETIMHRTEGPLDSKPHRSSQALQTVATIDVGHAVQLRVGLSSWSGSHKVELRVATATIPGVYFPTANGVAVNVEHLAELIAALQKAELEAIAGLISHRRGRAAA
jgi:hypothetical protein